MRTVKVDTKWKLRDNYITSTLVIPDFIKGHDEENVIGFIRNIMTYPEAEISIREIKNSS